MYHVPLAGWEEESASCFSPTAFWAGCPSALWGSSVWQTPGTQCCHCKPAGSSSWSPWWTCSVSQRRQGLTMWTGGGTPSCLGPHRSTYRLITLTAHARLSLSFLAIIPLQQVSIFVAFFRRYKTTRNVLQMLSEPKRLTDDTVGVSFSRR